MRVHTPGASASHATRRLGIVGLTALLLLSLGATAAPAQPSGGPPPAPVDPQNVVDQSDMTWDDYREVPDRREELYDPDTEGTQVTYRTAVILLEFEDQPFLITQEAGTHPFGNPQAPWTPVPEDEVNDWFYDYYATPNEFNGFNTINSYWLEDSHGRIGVDVEVFGPYTLPGKLHEYGLSGFGAPVRDEPDSICPAGDDCTKNIRNDGFEVWHDAIGCDPEEQGNLCGFDNGFWVTAGHDESSTWEEFGQMQWADREDVPAEFGPPGATEGPVLNSAGNPIPNWAPTRYVDWTSWQAAANHWPNAGGGTSTQAESSGLAVFAHEFSHLRGLPDNYNNPFADNIRNYTGYWEMMSRGSFNGPGGTHNRWPVPNQGGSALGPHHTLHYKNQLDVLMDDEQTTVERADLAEQGVAVATIQARSSVPDEGESAGFTVNYGEDVALNAACLAEGNESFWCPPGNTWDHDRLEVVDRVGPDSFVSDSGVLITHSRTSGSPRVWMVDANPEDIGMVDYVRPDGTPVMVVRGDPRQLNDAAFHAGTDSGSEFEYVNEAAGLHYYILDTWRDDDGVLQYSVAARSLDAADAYERGVELDTPEWLEVDDTTELLQVPLTNTGEAGEGLFDSDVFRITSSVEGDGWETWQPHEVVAAEAGDTIPVSVYATAGDGAAGAARVTITATSESDPSQSSTVTMWVGTAQGLVEAAGDLVADMDLHLGTEARLEANLQQIDNRLGRPTPAVCTALDVFGHSVDNRDGHRIGLSPQEAAELRSIARSMGIAIDC